MHLHTIPLTFAKGNVLHLCAGGHLRWCLAVRANNRRLLFRFYTSRLLQKVVDFVLDFEGAPKCRGGNHRFWHSRSRGKVLWLAEDDKMIFFNQLWGIGFYITRKGGWKILSFRGQKKDITIPGSLRDGLLLWTLTIWISMKNVP